MAGRGSSVIKAKEVIGSIRNWGRKENGAEESSQPLQPDQSVPPAPAQNELVDELTDKLLGVGLKLASVQLQNRHDVAQSIVKTHMIAGTSLALLPVPIFDLAALTGTQLSLLRSLSKHFDVDFDEQKGKALLTSLVSGAVPLLTVVGLSSFAKLIPGIGTIGGSISMTVLASSLIYATGQVFVRHFEQGGTLADFQSKYWKSFFMQQFEEKKTEMKQQKQSDGKNYINQHKQQFQVDASRDINFVKFDIAATAEDETAIKEAVAKLIDDSVTSTNISVKGLKNTTDYAEFLSENDSDLTLDNNYKFKVQVPQVIADDIFNGKEGPYTEEALPDPLSYYGKSKLAGENAVKIEGGDKWSIIRTNVVYGNSSYNKMDFNRWVVNALSEGKKLNIIDGQWCNPTLTDDIAKGVHRIIEKNERGLVNFAGRGYYNRYDIAMMIANVFNFDTELITKIPSTKLKQKAVRPERGGLTNLKAETSLNMTFSDLETGLINLKHQLNKDK